jgi:hypothetical protein
LFNVLLISLILIGAAILLFCFAFLAVFVIRRSRWHRRAVVVAAVVPGRTEPEPDTDTAATQAQRVGVASPTRRIAWVA